ncbi:hypothetical protein EJ05DRAFT_165093 [Pseudovirgaria hyperparasitica]|uniref:Uncharacterized protein n=1 Tax=Pseudovirgaria hyperparasitica TaxID=470096 RepID=A0A6A6VTW3_9PEZI|nr:uncharacterized protein EJ05DRAFT_165093 [Pseudovirgaria hyperparasitica]KAF2753585.1 hypothetical protein EJ05DRAFT_165093 [Pseudovirgaria hyperparasitica]
MLVNRFFLFPYSAVLLIASSSSHLHSILSSPFLLFSYNLPQHTCIHTYLLLPNAVFLLLYMPTTTNHFVSVHPCPTSICHASRLYQWPFRAPCVMHGGAPGHAEILDLTSVLHLLLELIDSLIN